MMMIVFLFIIIIYYTFRPLNPISELVYTSPNERNKHTATAPLLLAIFSNVESIILDSLFLYVCINWSSAQPPPPNLEI